MSFPDVPTHEELDHVRFEPQYTGRDHGKISYTIASDVVKQAKAAGIKITTKYVYVIRSHAKAKGRTARKQGRPKGSSTKHIATIAGDDSMARAFRKLVVALGVARSRILVDEVEGKIEALFG